MATTKNSLTKKTGDLLWINQIVAKRPFRLISASLDF